MDGQARGTGHAHSQKKAKELAVREAWTTMGWDASVNTPGAATSPEPLLLSLTPLLPSAPLQSPPNPAALAANVSGNAAGAWESVTIAGFNEVALKQRLLVTWQHTRTGDSHMPVWQSTCIGENFNHSHLIFLTVHLVNGEPKGDGTGRTKKESMLLAVRNTWRNLGWP